MDLTKELTEAVIPYAKSLGVFALGVVSIKIPEIDYLPELIQVNEWVKLIIDDCARLSGLWFIWRSTVMLNRRIKEKEAIIREKDAVTKGQELDNRIKANKLEKD